LHLPDHNAEFIDAVLQVGDLRVTRVIAPGGIRPEH